MRWFETRGPVYPEDNYVVARTEELADFVNRLEKGRYIVLFAPRQTGKTTFFRNALDTLERKENGYFPIQLNFERSADVSLSDFYDLCQLTFCFVGFHIYLHLCYKHIVPTKSTPNARVVFGGFQNSTSSRNTTGIRRSTSSFCLFEPVCSDCGWNYVS